MKHLGCVLFTVLVAVVSLTGCQGTMLNTTNVGQTIKPSARIGLVKTGPQSGRFSDGYVTVNYQYTAAGGNLQMSGTVGFGSAITGNYTGVQTFDLGLLMGDAKGRVLMQQGLTASPPVNVSSSINFNTSLLLPPQAISMAFTYNGTVYGTQGDSASIWADPVRQRHHRNPEPSTSLGLSAVSLIPSTREEGT
jgi:hypothetical protein